jgi:EEF1A lysine methyltransferase 4
MQTLTEDLWELGYKNQVSIDFSPVVIEQMKAKRPDLDWTVMDVRKMDFDKESIDVAVDKATLDAMLYGSLWDPEETVRNNVKAYVDEVCLAPPFGEMTNPAIQFRAVY